MIYFLLILVVILLIIVIDYFDMNVTRTKNNIYKLDREYKYKKRVKSKHKVVISFTTMPDRINKMKRTICSILKQSVRVDEIRINIPYKTSKGKTYIIPKWLKKLNNIHIYRVDKDWGPATKSLPTIKDESLNTRIIVVDDDVVYSYNTVKYLIYLFEKKNGRMAITNYGDNYNENASMKGILNYIKGSKRVRVIRGHSGYVITPKMFSKQVFDYSNAPEESFYVDDNWLSGWLRYNNVPILMMGLSYKCYPYSNQQTENTHSLTTDHNESGKNEEVVNAWFEKKCV